MITLDNILDELLSIEKPPEVKPPTISQRIHNFIKRKELDKQIEDERQEERNKIIKLGTEADTFLKSIYYRDLIEPQIRQSIKGGISRLLTISESMTESQIRAEIAGIKKSWEILGSIRLKIINAENIKKADVTSKSI